MKVFILRDFLWASKKQPMSVEHADSLLTFLIIGVIIGGRLGYVVFYNNYRGSLSYGEDFALLLQYKYSSKEDFAFETKSPVHSNTISIPKFSGF